MKSPRFILLLGIAGCIAAFCLAYAFGTAHTRIMASESRPELAWLKHEFKLSDAEYKRIEAMHLAYLPGCAERCRKIDEQNQKLNRLLATNPGMTPEVQQLLKERAEMRAACESEMLKHFIQVSQTMQPEQGRRYLAWVKQQAFMAPAGMEQHHGETESSHSH